MRTGRAPLGDQPQSLWRRRCAPWRAGRWVLRRVPVGRPGGSKSAAVRAGWAAAGPVRSLAGESVRCGWGPRCRPDRPLPGSARAGAAQKWAVGSAGARCVGPPGRVSRKHLWQSWRRSSFRTSSAVRHVTGLRCPPAPASARFSAQLCAVSTGLRGPARGRASLLRPRLPVCERTAV